MLRVVFLDRDGVINEKPKEHQYITKPEDFVFNHGLGSLLSEYIKEGLSFIVITNQRGIARGLLRESDLQSIHKVMVEGLRKWNINILDIFYCPHDIGKCACRKPQPGLLLAAQNKYDIDFKNSILISDSQEDVEMGALAGIGKNILVETDSLKVLKVAYGKN